MPTDATPGCPVREAFDPLSPEYLADPYAIMAALPLAAEPIFYAPSIGYAPLAPDPADALPGKNRPR